MSGLGHLRIEFLTQLAVRYDVAAAGLGHLRIEFRTQHASQRLRPESRLGHLRIEFRTQPVLPSMSSLAGLEHLRIEFRTQPTHSPDQPSAVLGIYALSSGYNNARRTQLYFTVELSIDTLGHTLFLCGETCTGWGFYTDRKH